jgi:ferritin-like metal-binding protein YciE
VPVKLSNPRDLLLQLLGEALYIERRLAGGVLRDLIDAVRDEALRDTLEHHLEQTKTQVGRAETAFRRLDAAPSANLSQGFEAAVAEHDELAGSLVEPTLADVFHAQAALRTEHMELGLYAAILMLADACGRGDELEPLRESAAEEHNALERVERKLSRLSGTLRPDRPRTPADT